MISCGSGWLLMGAGILFLIMKFGKKGKELNEV